MVHEPTVLRDEAVHRSAEYAIVDSIDNARDGAWIADSEGSVVRVYEKIALDIRDRLESQLYIHSVAIGEQSTHLNKLKIMAYCIGPMVIDILMIVWARMKDRIIAGNESIEKSILAEPEIKQLLTESQQPISQAIRKVVGIPSQCTTGSHEAHDDTDRSGESSADIQFESVDNRDRLAG